MRRQDCLSTCSVIIVSLLMLGIFFLNGKTAAAMAMMPVAEVMPGMHGIAKTVVAGNTIEEFDVEVLGILKQKGPAGDLILVRVSGDVVERTGGIAEGMSGSPVYIDNKLVGAISYGWSLTDHKTGMVTPIADMLKLWNMPQGKEAITQEARRTAPPPDEENEEELPKGMEARNTPLLVAGLTENSLKFLQEHLQPYHLQPYAVGNELPDGVTAGPLEPGGPVGVQLMRGDISMGALGTVTYLEDGKILAFGHPFLKRGRANYFMTNAYVLTTMKGLENSFKVGVTGDVAGVIDQDRGAGISGRFGTYPAIIPVNINVWDRNLNQSKEISVQVVNDEELAPTLVIASLLNAIEKAGDRVGSGSAKVKFTVSSPDLPGEVLSRENLFYSPANIGELAVSELFEGLTLLATNHFKTVDIVDIKVEVTTAHERPLASILEASTNVDKVKPGERVPISVKLKPFRGEPVTRQVSFLVPADQPVGPLTLLVRGGGVVSLAQFFAHQQSSGGDEDLAKLLFKAKPQSLAEAVRELSERDRNNDLVVESIDAEPDAKVSENEGKKIPSPKLENKPQPKPPQSRTMADYGAGDKAILAAAAVDNSKGKPIEGKKKYHVSTDYIIDNTTQLVVNVEKIK